MKEKEDKIKDKKAVKKVQDKKEKVLYLGPIIKKGKYYPNMILSEFPEDDLKEELTKFPALKELFVPLNKVSKARQQIFSGKGALVKIIEKIEEGN